MNKGKLIVIDGVDGSGKKTQAEMLIKRLKKLKKKVVLINFPQYNDFFGKVIRRYLDGEFGGVDEVSGYLASILYAADRWRAKEKIEKYLNDGYIVIANRYTESNMAHQGAKIKSPSERKKFLQWLNEMEFKVFAIPRADQVIYLDVPVEISRELVDGRGIKKDIHEENLDYLKKTRLEYLHLSQAKKTWHRINCVKNNQILSRREIAEKIWQVLNPKFD